MAVDILVVLISLSNCSISSFSSDFFYLDVQFGELSLQ